MRSIIFRSVAAAALASLAWSIPACSGTGTASVGGAPADGGPSTTATGGGTLEVLFSPMYSSFDGTHTFQVPAGVAGVGGITWSASDPSMVTITPSNNGSQVMITTLKAGTVTITATAGSLSGSSTLTIGSATADLWDIGNQRYNNGVVLHHGAPSDGGSPKEAACTNCHGAGSRMDVEHTPEQTGGYSDQDLVNIFTQGQKPAGVPQRIMPYDRWHQIHQWQMTDQEKSGLIVYLRSLTPTAQGPTVDFGGHWGGDGGHGEGGGGPGAGGGNGGGPVDAGGQ